jgi:hypothetical protein
MCFCERRKTHQIDAIDVFGMHQILEQNLRGCSISGLEMRRNMLCEDVCKVFEIVNASVLEVQKTHQIDVLACIRS